jgi:hypothetical protein
MKLLCIALMAIVQKQVAADMYLQFPGGGNNRLNEPNRERRNKNRLFDSQNNNRFGHNQHGHYFYTDSEIDMQWTVQHSCGPDSNLNCEVILQYACEDDLRDGQVTDTIPKRNEDCKKYDCNSDFTYGMHEDYQYYQHCALRERNQGLFPADRNIKGDTARYTRQENNGERYGYECNEERDHYPYWHPTIWKDIAVFTDNTSRCQYYQEESENVKGKWYCHVSDEFLDEHYDPDTKDFIIPIDKEGCEALEGASAEWKQSDPHTYPNGDAMPPPVCEAAPYQRDNHHGNGDSGYFVGHKWTVPEQLVHSNCAIRLRYNISSTDYDAWNIDDDAKERDDRLNDKPSTHVGKCYGLGEGPARISGYDFDSLNIDMSTALEIKPRNDERILLTRESADSDIWRVTTKTHGGNQWMGWRDNDFGRKKVKVSFDINFAKKPTGGNYGMKFFGTLINDWVDDAQVDEWHHVDLDYTLPNGGDGDHIILIFDGVSVDFELQNFQLCTEDELAVNGNPFASFQDDFGWGPYEARQRGYEHKNDARLQIFDEIDMKLRSAYNTDQLGRVFEDRSHKIKFVQLPEDIKQDVITNNKKVYNLNARGKIGNNVEVYPAFEYDFAPSRLVAQEGDYIHIQWSGSNTNDRNNDHSQTESNGNPVEDLRGKDRHNMVAIDSMGAIRPTSDLEKLSSLLGLDAVESMSLAFSGVQGGDNEYLQSAGAYFDLGIKKLTEKGKHMFMSAINNSHGVRTQKGKIIVE